MRYTDREQKGTFEPLVCTESAYILFYQRRSVAEANLFYNFGHHLRARMDACSLVPDPTNKPQLEQLNNIHLYLDTAIRLDQFALQMLHSLQLQTLQTSQNNGHERAEGANAQAASQKHWLFSLPGFHPDKECHVNVPSPTHRMQLAV